MRSLLRFAAVAVVVLSSFSSYSQIYSSDKQSVGREYVPGQVLVRFRPGRSASARLAAHSRAQAAVRQQFAVVPDLQLVSLVKGVRVEDAIAAYRSDPNVLYAEPNYIRRATQSPIAPNDPLFDKLWGLHNTGVDGGTAGVDIKAPEAWAISKGSRNVVVAVIDTGIDYTHPDLAANIWSNPGDCNTNGVDDDGDGYVDDCHGIDTVNHDSDPLDDNGHGTHVAGTIGAVGNNGVGVVGVNWTVSIIGCKFLDISGHGNDAGAIACLDWLAGLKQRGVNIVATNNSWGGGAFGQSLHDAIQRHRDLGILFIAAAGNSAADNDTGGFYPSNYALSNIIAVSATTRKDALAGFSDYGRHTVHIGAPGEQIQSTYPNNRYAVMSGTSMATPHVTGAVALLAAAHPEFDWKAIKNRITSSGDAIPALQNTITGRRLNAKAALTCSNSEVLAPISPYEQVLGTVGKPVAVTALHINCELPGGSVNATIDPGGIGVALLDDGQDADEVAGDGIYSGAWTPSAPGVYTYTMEGETGKIVVDPYQANSVPMQWRDITSTGIGLAMSGLTYQLQLPFPVSIAGRALDSITISQYGMITAPANWAFVLPSTRLPDDTADIALAPFGEYLWGDGVQNTRNVFWGTVGDTPNRELVIEWRDIQYSGCTAPSDGGVTFQVVLFENSTDILYNYKDVTFGGACAAHDNGATANVGLQPGTGSAVQYSFQEAKLADNAALLWRLNPDFPPNPAPVLNYIDPHYFVTSNYYSGAYMLASGNGFLRSSVLTLDGAPRLFLFEDATRALVVFSKQDFAEPHTVKAAIFNALPGGGKSQAIDYEIKQQDFTLQLTSNTVDLTTATYGTTTAIVMPAPAVIDPVEFNCTTSDPRLTCIFSNPEVFGGFESPVSSDLRIYRTGSASASAAAPALPLAPQSRPILLGTLLGSVALSIVGFAHLRGSRRRLAATLMVVLFVAATQFACGGGGSSTPPPPPPTATLTASPTTVGTGQTSTLTWTTSNANTVTLDQAAVTASGAKAVSPSTTTTYHLVAQGSGGSKEATATVSVINTTTATITITVSAAGVQRTATVTVIFPA